MDSNVNEDALLKDPNKLLSYLDERINEMQENLNDDKDFGNKDIDGTFQQLRKIEKKFEDKIQEYKTKLDKFRQDHQDASENKQKLFQNQSEDIKRLYSLKKYDQAWNKFKDYERQFQQHSSLIDQIPKLHINESDIEQLFSTDKKAIQSQIQTTITKTAMVSTVLTNDYHDDDDDKNNMTKKERARKEKVYENIDIDKDDKDVDDSNDNKPEYDNSLFGCRSKRSDDQPTTTTTDAKSSSTSVSSRPRLPFSTRLGPTSNSKNLPFSGRNISSLQNNNTNSRDNQNQPSIQRPIIKTNTLTSNPVSHYVHESNKILIMACNAQYIILFKSQRNRLDKWQLGAIERRTHNELNLDWHNGLIISMGHIEKNFFYMYTERELFIYSLDRRSISDSRMLPHGNDDGLEITNLSSNESYRGIGATYDKFIYHIYLNRNSHWTLSKHLLDKYVHIHNYDLTLLFPDVDRFIHFCINDKTINFLVQLNDLSYAVVFCLRKDCTTNDSLPIIILSNAKKPLTICSAYNHYLKTYLFFINDPSIDTLHILNSRQYLESYIMTIHALCYVADNHELIIVTNNSISSINLNEENSSFFSKYSIN